MRESNVVEAPVAQMRQMLYGRLLSQALATVAVLRVPDLLADGPASPSELAEATHTHEPSLRRLLRDLSTFDVFTEEPDGMFGLRPLGQTLCDNAPISLRPTAMLINGDIGRSWNQLASTVRTGTSAFSQAIGEEFFPYLDNNPVSRETFDRSQVEEAAEQAGEILSEVPFSDYRTVVDLGGGDGYLLSLILKQNLTMRGVLVELPMTAKQAGTRFEKENLSERAEVHAGDFFTGVPDHGELYMFSRVLHDWNDHECVRLLRKCRSVMPASATLLIIDLVVTEVAGTQERHQASALMDLYMMTLFGDAKERSLKEFTILLAEAGFGIEKTTLLSSGLVAIQASAKEC